MRFNHEERINFLYQSVVHHHSLNSIVQDTGAKYTTVYTILKEYQEHGRTNRQLNYQEKVNRLNLRAKRNFNMLQQLKTKGILPDCLKLQYVHPIGKIQKKANAAKKISDAKASKQINEDSIAKTDSSVDPLNLDTIESQDVILCEFRKYEHCQLMLLASQDDTVNTLCHTPNDAVEKQS